MTATVHGLEELRRAGRIYKAAGKDLRKQVRDAMKAAAGPLGEHVVSEGAEAMPSRGGLQARIRASRGTISARLTGSNPTVVVQLRNRQRDALGGLNAGVVRHPVFQTGRWVSQSVPAGSFTAAFERHAPEVRDKVLDAMQGTLDDIARKV